MDLLADLCDASAPISEDWSKVWAASGAAALSGRADGRPLDVPHAMVALAARASAKILASTRRLGAAVSLDGPALLGERAALTGFSRRGHVSCGGATRLLHAVDGWIGVSLARASDLPGAAAWLEAAALDIAEADDLAGAVTQRSVSALVDRGALLGMAVAGLGERACPTSLAPATQLGSSPAVASVDALVVVDLSALWR